MRVLVEVKNCDCTHNQQRASLPEDETMAVDSVGQTNPQSALALLPPILASSSDPIHSLIPSSMVAQSNSPLQTPWPNFGPHLVAHMGSGGGLPVPQPAAQGERHQQPQNVQLQQYHQHAGYQNQNQFQHHELQLHTQQEETQAPYYPHGSSGSAQQYPTILLTGLTGAGKSTFISHLTSEQVIIGHDLESSTAQVQAYDCIIGGVPVRLIDTPGFDDNERSETDILSEIALPLAMLYKEREVKLAGVLYLHRISDIRVGGASRRSIRLLEALCGAGNYSAVTVVTTMWSKLTSQEEGHRRERELISNREFFGALYEGSTRIVRHTGGRASADEIISSVLNQRQAVVLDIQRELVDLNISLEQTTAGKLVDAGLRQQQERQERELAEIESSFQNIRDETTTAALAEEQDAQRARLEQLSLARTNLRSTLEELADRLVTAQTASTATTTNSREVPGDDKEIVMLQRTVQMLQNQLEETNIRQEVSATELMNEQRKQRLKSQEEEFERKMLNKKLQDCKRMLAEREMIQVKKKQKESWWRIGRVFGGGSVDEYNGRQNYLAYGPGFY